MRRARARLEEWTFEGRASVYAERFEGEDAVVTREELAVLDRIDAELTRTTGDGLWDADEYGIVATDEPDGDGPRVVRTYHPEIPYEGYRGVESLDGATGAELDDVRREYCEGVAGVVQDRLDVFLGDGGESQAAARETRPVTTVTPRRRREPTRRRSDAPTPTRAAGA